MAAIREARRKWLAQRLRQIAAEERDSDVAENFLRLAEDIGLGREQRAAEE